MKNKMKTGLSFIVLLALLTLPDLSQAAEKNYLIGYRQTPTAADTDLVRQHGGKVHRHLRKSKVVTARLTEDGVAKLRRDRRVAFVEEDKTVSAIDPPPSTSTVVPMATSTDPEYAAAWSVDRIGSKAAHDAGILGTGVKVAVLDTGIDYTHPDLIGRVQGGENFISLDPNFNDYMDDSYNSHGTHVAGIIAAARNGSGVVGVAPEASLYAIKILDGSGFGTLSALVAGIEWAVANGVHVINISAALNEPSLALEQACRAAWEAGIMVVAAAGNTYGGPVQYPAAYDTVVAVSATENQDNVIALSSAGPEVELAAPGGGVYSTVSGGGYNSLIGTSQATPHVTGAAALVLSSGNLTDQDGDSALTVQDLRLALQKTAKDLTVPGRDATSGFGLVQAAGAAGVSPPVEQRQTVSLTLTVTRSGPRADQRTVTLASGSYHIAIQNSGLTAISVQSSRPGMQTTPRIYRFKGRNPALTFDLDAGTGPTTVTLTPYGKVGAAAFIQAVPF